MEDILNPDYINKPRKRHVSDAQEEHAQVCA